MPGRAVLNLFLLAALAFTVALNYAFRPDPSRPNLEYFPDMAHSPRYNAYSPNPNFADGKTLREPPAGAIARGWMPLHYAATPQDALRAGQELVSPVASDERVLERGRKVWADFCQTCHGPAGLGDGPVVQRGYPAPPSLLAEKALKMKDGQMFHILTYGQNNMPPYAAQVSREDRWAVIAYVRSLQKTAAPPAAVAEGTPGPPAAAPAKVGQ